MVPLSEWQGACAAPEPPGFFFAEQEVHCQDQRDLANPETVGYAIATTFLYL